MKNYMVWAMVRSEDAYGKKHIGWTMIGVFQAAEAEAACRAAAKKSQQMGTFFAVEGFPWGIDLMEIDASEFGMDDEAKKKLDRLEQQNANLGAELTRLQQLEIRSREMEREAGIDS